MDAKDFKRIKTAFDNWLKADKYYNDYKSLAKTDSKAEIHGLIISSNRFSTLIKTISNTENFPESLNGKRILTFVKGWEGWIKIRPGVVGIPNPVKLEKWMRTFIEIEEKKIDAPGGKGKKQGTRKKITWPGVDYTTSFPKDRIGEILKATSPTALIREMRKTFQVIKEDDRKSLFRKAENNPGILHYSSFNKIKYWWIYRKDLHILKTRTKKAKK